MADLGSSGINIVGNHSNTLPSRTGGGLNPVPKRKRTDLAPPKRVDVAGHREVGSDQLDVVCGHGFLPWPSRDRLILHFARTRLRSGAWIIPYRGSKDENRNWKWFESGRGSCE
jgi:hypothetical protein